MTMEKETAKRRWRLGCTVIAITVACFFVLPQIGFGIRGAGIRNRLRKADPQVLTACRQMVADALLARGSIPKSRYENLTGPKTLPPVIAQLRPSYVIIRKDHVLMCFCPLPRVYLVAYTVDAQQSGSEKLIDGLWITTGSP